TNVEEDTDGAEHGGDGVNKVQNNKPEHRKNTGNGKSRTHGYSSRRYWSVPGPVHECIQVLFQDLVISVGSPHQAISSQAQHKHRHKVDGISPQKISRHR